MVKKTFTAMGKAYNKSLSLIFSPTKSPTSRLQVQFHRRYKCTLKAPQKLGMVTLGTLAPGSLRQEGQEFKVNLAVP